MSGKTHIRVQILDHARGLDLPRYQTAGASGLDLCAALARDDILVLDPGETALVPTGLVMEIPETLEAQVRPRSGLAAKFGITVLNSPGTIDSDYRGEIRVILINHGKAPLQITRGMRIAQLIFQKIEKVRLVESVELTSSKRGAGGFGSTGEGKQEGEDNHHATGNP
ncbi:MAG TPA: dUTP diphosphatase [Rhizobiales bacterium]|nr:dUTP diphosphatase [Hyphomicrobiales bacterium]